MKYRNCWIVCGPESSGSSFLAKTLSYAIGKCSYPGEYSGYAYNNSYICENFVLHRSIPYGRPKHWAENLLHEIDSFKYKFEKVNFILTTRDRNISTLSKIKRFNENANEAQEDFKKASSFFHELTMDLNTYIWSYESMILLGDSYFKRMYKFFNIKSDYIPNIYDGNEPYIQTEYIQQ